MAGTKPHHTGWFGIDYWRQPAARYSGNEHDSGLGDDPLPGWIGSEEHLLTSHGSPADLDHQGASHLVTVVGHAHSPASEFLIG
jgi:hypothetical protein